MRLNNNVLLILLIVAVAAPATVATSYFLITRDPTVRPLALSRAGEAAARGQSSGTHLVAYVDWGENAVKRFSQATLTNGIAGAFYAHGAEVDVIVRDVAGSDRVTITYQVGANRYGPVPVQHAAQGIRAAIEAYRLSIRGRTGGS